MIWQPLLLSLQVTFVALALMVAVGLPLALVLARRRFRGATVVEALVNLPLVLPPTVVGYYLLLALGRGSPAVEWFGWRVLFTWGAAAIASAVVGLPLLVQSAHAAVAGVDPALENAARTLGSSELEVLWRITLPLAATRHSGGYCAGRSSGAGRIWRHIDGSRQHPRSHSDAAAGYLRCSAKPALCAGERHGGADDRIGLLELVGCAAF